MGCFLLLWFLRLPLLVVAVSFLLRESGAVVLSIGRRRLRG
jgi:hypothetical protein